VITESSHFSMNPRQSAYATAFPNNQLPFGGSGWANGYSDGTLWNNMRSTPGLAFGTQVNGGANFLDGIAHLLGVWGADQSVTATCVSTNRVSLADSNAGNCTEEVEILLRFSIVQGTAIGYEITFSVDPNPTNGQYIQLNRWNGGSGAFTLLASGTHPTTVNNGSILFASIIGTVITVKVDGVSVGGAFPYDTASDNPKYANGAPGIGHYYSNANGVGTYAASDFGLSTFAVTTN
jgi:hypothetical protein